MAAHAPTFAEETASSWVAVRELEWEGLKKSAGP
jgi:hypothetical protein